MDRFLEMRTFAQVADAGSFVKAADELEMSKAAVSRYVSDLEARLGVRLMHRTTRRLSLTDEGQVFLARCKEVLTALEEAETEVTAGKLEPTGLLRVNAPFTFGIRHLAGLWGEFKGLHPGVTFDVTLTDRVVDLVDEGYDLAVRIAAQPSSTLISRRIASTRAVLCASPKYLKAHGRPRELADLAQHAIIAYSYLASGDEWRFTGPEGPVHVKVNPCIHANNGDTCRAAALAHQGIILEPTFLVGPDLDSGALVELLPQYRGVEFGIHLVYPSRKHVPPKVRRLVDFLAERFSTAPWRA